MVCLADVRGVRAHLHGRDEGPIADILPLLLYPLLRPRGEGAGELCPDLAGDFVGQHFVLAGL